MNRNDINRLNKNFKNSILGFDREKSKVKVKALTLTNSRCSVKSENQRCQKITKIIYLETREKIEFINIEFVIFG